MNYQETPFVKILIPVIIGILSDYYKLVELEKPTLTLVTFLIFACCLMQNISYKSLALYRRKVLINASIFVFLLSFGIWISKLNDSREKDYFINPNFDGLLKIRVEEEPKETAKSLRFTASILTRENNQEIISSSGKMMVTLLKGEPNKTTIEYGEEAWIKGRVDTIPDSYNPGQFDYKTWLASKNIYNQLLVSSKFYRKTGKYSGNWLKHIALKIRKKQVDYFDHLIKNKEAFAVASTLILGYRADLNPEILSAYSKTGTIHALSVSGMHVGLIYLILNWILQFLNRKKILKILKIGLIIILIWFYAFLTGLSPSVLRSAIMLSVYVIAKNIHKSTNSINILAFTGFSMLLIDPLLFFDVGFQLSFLAVSGLIILYPIIYSKINSKNKIIDWFCSSISISLAAQLATFTLSIYYFHQFPIYFLISNLFITIPVTLLMYLGISILIFKLSFLAPIFEWLILFMNDGLRWIADLPFAGITQISLEKIDFLLLSSSLLFLIASVVQGNKKIALIAACLFITYQASSAWTKLEHSRQRIIIFFNIEKHFATAFIDGNSAIFITDIERNEKNFNFYIQPAIDKLQIKNLKTIKLESNVNFSNFKKSRRVIRFYDSYTLILDRSLGKQLITSRKKFNFIWLSGGSSYALLKLIPNLKFHKLIIDNKNSIRMVQAIKHEMNINPSASYSLRKNKAYLVHLN